MNAKSYFDILELFHHIVHLIDHSIQNIVAKLELEIGCIIDLEADPLNVDMDNCEQNH